MLFILTLEGLLSGWKKGHKIFGTNIEGQIRILKTKVLDWKGEKKVEGLFGKQAWAER